MEAKVLLVGSLVSLVWIFSCNCECEYRLLTPFLLTIGAYLWWQMRSREEITSSHAIVITGCDSGLGYSLAIHCSDLGATVIAGVLHEDSPGAAELSNRANVRVLSLDVTDVNSVRDFGSAVSDTLRRNNLILKSVVNNAGIMIFGEFEWQTENQIRSQVEVNLIGTMRVTKELMPHIRRDTSRLIIVSSHCADQPLPGIAAYGATKAALSAWSVALRVELKKYGIKVVSFIPGSFTQESNILAQQSKHFEKMKSAMSDDAKKFYSDYFDIYARYFAPMAREVSPEKLKNEAVFRTFEGALLDKYPSAYYKCEPWRYFFYYTLCKFTPVCIRDRLILSFVQLPSWKATKNH